MKTLTFVILYFVSVQINCDINKNNSYTERTNNNLTDENKTLRKLFPSNNNENETIEQIKFDIDQSLLDDEDKGRFCLKNLSNCEKNDDEYQKTTKKLSNYIFQSIPPFDFSKTNGVNPACQRDLKIYIKDLKKFKLWALKMYDSTAKIPSGLLNGNINQLGDFDLCLAANEENFNVNGKYCLATLNVKIPKSPYLSALHTLLQSYYHIKSNIDDPGHRVPRFSSIHWALCVPSTCTPDDVEKGLKYKINKFLQDTDLDVDVKVHEHLCNITKDSQKPPLSTYYAIAFLFGYLLFEIMATFYDYYALGHKNEWITSFSLIKNFNQIKNVKKSNDEIEAIHGIRFLNAILLLLAHKCMAVFFIPYTNRTEMVELLARPWTVLGRAASLYTDPFIMFSGTLTTYSLIKKLKKTNKINIFDEYISRLMRILPTFAALIGFCTYIMPWLNSGPMWNLLITQYSNICKKYGWRNLLFIHNYYGFKNMCLTHTHHIGIDTQLFFTSPIFVYILWKWPKNGSFLLIGLALWSTFLRFYVTYTMNLNNYVQSGTSIKQLFDTADYMYILPLHRLTVYIMGIFLGYILSYHKTTTLSKIQIHLGNMLALICFIISYFGPSYMGHMEYKYRPIDGAWYAAIAPILWCFTFSWIVFTSHIGYKGFFGKIFSWSKFMLWTKISYTVYLTQFPIYFYNVGITRSAERYAFFNAMFNFKEYGWILFTALILTLTVELPFQNIRNLMLKKPIVAPKKIN